MVAVRDVDVREVAVLVLDPCVVVVRLPCGNVSCSNANNLFNNGSGTNAALFLLRSSVLPAKFRFSFGSSV